MKPSIEWQSNVLQWDKRELSYGIEHSNTKWMIITFSHCFILLYISFYHVDQTVECLVLIFFLLIPKDWNQFSLYWIQYWIDFSYLLLSCAFEDCFYIWFCVDFLSNIWMNFRISHDKFNGIRNLLFKSKCLMCSKKDLCLWKC